MVRMMPRRAGENSLFDAKVADFKKAGAAIVGVRNEAGAKNAAVVSQTLVIDEADAVRTEINIKKDLFGLLGGRETYVINKKGEVEFVYNNQFKPEDHVEKSLSYIEENIVESTGIQSSVCDSNQSTDLALMLSLRVLK
jgi:peroxiredoxin